MTNDYSKLDEAILAAIRQGRTRLIRITLGEVLSEARAFGVKSKCGDDATWRVVDRRLQALRKAGKITYNAKTGWSLVEQGATP